MTTPAKHDIEAPPFWARFKASRFYDPISRAYHSFAQAAVAVAFVGGVIPAAGLGSVPWQAALLAGAGAALSSLILSAVTFPVPALPVAADTVVRLARTFLNTLGGLFAASGLTVVTFGWRGALLAAASAAVGALVKTYLVNGAEGGNVMVQGRIDQQRDTLMHSDTVVRTV